MKIQMLGLMRWSYVGLRGYQKDHATFQERRDFLYDPARLERRWFWFEHVALPGLVAQTDPDFTLVLMTGPDLPEPYLSRLCELAEVVPQFRLALVPPMEKHLEACLTAIEPYLDRTADVIGHFRQDDDDAVAIDYIHDARRDFDVLQPLWQRRRRLSCDYSRGLIVKATAAGVTVEPRMSYNATAGLTVYLPPDAGRSIIHFPHWQIGLSMPGATMPGKVMFARFLNHDNDSGAIGAGYAWKADDVDWRMLLAERFRIDLPTLDQAARVYGLPGADRPRWGI